MAKDKDEVTQDDPTGSPAVEPETTEAPPERAKISDDGEKTINGHGVRLEVYDMDPDGVPQNYLVTPMSYTGPQFVATYKDELEENIPTIRDESLLLPTGD
jgi:hypothetical protein